jgi:hypothetical protein
MRRVHRRAQQPQLRLGHRGRSRLENVTLVRDRHPHTARAHQCDDVIEILGESLDIAIVAAGRTPQSHRCDRVGTGRPADTEVDPPRMCSLQQCELLGDSQRCVVGQHDAARAQPQRCGVRGQMGDDHRRARRRDRGHVVVLGDPEAGVSQPIGRLRQAGRGRQRIRRGLVGAYRDEVEDRKPHCSFNATLSSPLPRSAPLVAPIRWMPAPWPARTPHRASVR